MPNDIFHTRRRGSALITVVILGAIMTVCALFAYRSTIFQKRLAERSQVYLSAMAVAEAGAELAMVELNKDASSTPVAWTGWSGSTTRSYSETIEDNHGNAIGETEVLVSDVDSEPKIVATGYIPSKAEAQLSRTVQLSAKNDTVPSPFGGFGIFAFQDIDMKGNSKAYGNTGSGGSIYLQGNADIVGNAQAKGSITTKGNADVTKKSDQYSNPTPPPDIPTPELALDLPDSNDNDKIIAYAKNGKRQAVPSYGSKKNAIAQGNNDMTIPAPGTYRLNSFQLSGNSDIAVTGSGTVDIFVEDEFSMTGNGKLKVDEGITLNIIAKETVSLSGNKDIMVEGNGPVNIVAKDLQLGGNSAINFAGKSPVTIWVENTLRMRGNSDINAGRNGNAANLILFAKGSVDINLRGNPDVKGVLYAPTADVDMGGNCTWTGAVIGKTIQMSGNNNIYADEDLLQPTGGDGTYVTAWVEVAPRK